MFFTSGVLEALLFNYNLFICLFILFHYFTQVLGSHLWESTCSSSECGLDANGVAFGAWGLCVPHRLSISIFLKWVVSYILQLVVNLTIFGISVLYSANEQPATNSELWHCMGANPGWLVRHHPVSTEMVTHFGFEYLHDSSGWGEDKHLNQLWVRA